MKYLENRKAQAFEPDKPSSKCKEPWRHGRSPTSATQVWENLQSDRLGTLTFGLKKAAVPAGRGGCRGCRAEQSPTSRMMMDTKKRMKQDQILALGWVQVSARPLFPGAFLSLPDLKMNSQRNSTLIANSGIIWGWPTNALTFYRPESVVETQVCWVLSFFFFCLFLCNNISNILIWFVVMISIKFPIFLPHGDVNHGLSKVPPT